MSELALPKTSVIVPARNAAATIAQTLNCVVGQTDANWEAIVVDDRSSDATGQMISDYARLDPRIRLLPGPGQGVSAARNAALGVARGRRIHFLDADDWVDLDFLQQMNDALDQKPGSVAAYCAYRRVTPNGRLSPPTWDPDLAKAPLERFARSVSVAIHTVVADHSLIQRIGGFDTSLRTCEDWDFWQRLARLGGEWIHVDRVMSYYRTSQFSLSSNSTQMKADARVVIARGFSIDARVSDAPAELAIGAMPQTHYGPEQAYGYFALWVWAREIGSRRPNALDTDVLHSLTPATSHTYNIVSVVIDGLMVGLQTDIEHLVDEWANYALRVHELFDRLSAGDPTPGARRKLQYAFELLLLKNAALTAPRELDLTLGLKVDLKHLKPTIPSPGVDRLYVGLCMGDRLLRVLDLGIVAPMSPDDWLEIAAREFGDRCLLEIATPASLRLLTKRRSLSLAQKAAGWVGRDGLRIAQLRSRMLAPLPGSHGEKVQALIAAASASATAVAVDIAPPRTARRSAETEHNGDRRAFFEKIFEETDPWNYGSQYEQEKYNLQLEILPDGAHDIGMELACAEGMFTRMVASRFRRLLATDISKTALARTKTRCAGLEQISFQVLDLAADPLPTGLDVIFCSEVLYFLQDQNELAQVARRLANALRLGGTIISAHAYLLKDTPNRTGFDWGHPYGAKTIAETFAETEGLALERTIETEYYRVDRFRRVDASIPRPEPQIEWRAVSPILDFEVARHLVRGGAKTRRAEVAYTERPTSLPVLMYHSIADDGPAALAPYRTTPERFDAQLHWLRQNGYHTIGSEELLWFIQNHQPFYGRPVVITFDDALQDFATAAWPILHNHDFIAEVFVVTDLVGDTARWDAAYGPPAPLMDARTIARLHAEGVSFGSHLATHSAADGLPTLDLIEELARSRAALSQWLGRPVNSLAAPYGASDDRLRGLARDAGYKMCFGTNGRFASLWDNPFDVPRIEVRGGWSLDEFRRALGRDE